MCRKLFQGSVINMEVIDLTVESIEEKQQDKNGCSSSNDFDLKN